MGEIEFVQKDTVPFDSTTIQHKEHVMGKLSCSIISFQRRLIILSLFNQTMSISIKNGGFRNKTDVHIIICDR